VIDLGGGTGVRGWCPKHVDGTLRKEAALLVHKRNITAKRKGRVW